MGLSTVVTDIAPLYHGPGTETGRIDEELYGMSVQMIQQSEDGWCYVRSEHSTEGYTPARCLGQNVEVAAAWRKYKKSVVLAPYVDIQRQPKLGAARVASAPRGGIVVALGQESADGWQKVGLPTGEVGFTRASYIGEVITDWAKLREDDMRWNIVESALSYNGTTLRGGGRSPLGIDAVGLVAMSYLLNGVVVPRENYFKGGLTLQQVNPKEMDEGDILYFRETLGIYIGNNKFIHVSDAAGEEGVLVNSLRPKDKDYRGDLAEHIVAVASLY